MSTTTYHEPTSMAVTANRRGRIVMLCAATAVFVATFLFRFLTLEFMNDHFVHLTRGRQILLGDVPVRDFFDPGLLPAVLRIGRRVTPTGSTLLGEAILTVSHRRATRTPACPSRHRG